MLKSLTQYLLTDIATLISVPLTHSVPVT